MKHLFEKFLVFNVSKYIIYHSQDFIYQNLYSKGEKCSKIL